LATEQVGKSVALLTCFQKCPIRISIGTSAILTEGFRGFLQFLQKNAGTVPHSGPIQLPSTSYPIHFNFALDFTFDFVFDFDFALTLKNLEDCAGDFGFDDI
jgi:hypothetical protein